MIAAFARGIGKKFEMVPPDAEEFRRLLETFLADDPSSKERRRTLKKAEK